MLRGVYDSLLRYDELTQGSKAYCWAARSPLRYLAKQSCCAAAKLGYLLNAFVVNAYHATAQQH